MKHQIFSVYDNKAMAFIPPFNMPQIEMAQRSFTECANDLQHMFCKHPQDFNLYHIGSFDDATGTIETLDIPINLGMALQYKTNQG